MRNKEHTYTYNTCHVDTNILGLNLLIGYGCSGGVYPLAGKTRALSEKAAAGSYEKRQILWKDMAGRSWTQLVQQHLGWASGGFSPAAEADCILDEEDRPSTWGPALEGVDWAGEGE